MPYPLPLAANLSVGTFIGSKTLLTHCQRVVQIISIMIGRHIPAVFEGVCLGQTGLVNHASVSLASRVPPTSHRYTHLYASNAPWPRDGKRFGSVAETAAVALFCFHWFA